MVNIVTDPLLIAGMGKRPNRVDKIGACPNCKAPISFKTTTIGCICRCGKYLHREDLLDAELSIGSSVASPYVAKGFSQHYVEDPNHGIMTKEQAERHYKAERATGKKLGVGHSRPQVKEE
jgi:hypothetical protein